MEKEFRIKYSDWQQMKLLPLSNLVHKTIKSVEFYELTGAPNYDRPYLMKIHCEGDITYFIKMANGMQNGEPVIPEFRYYQVNQNAK